MFVMHYTKIFTGELFWVKINLISESDSYLFIF